MFGAVERKREEVLWQRPAGWRGGVGGCLLTASCALLARRPDFVRIGVAGCASWPRGRSWLTLILIAQVGGIKVLFVHVIEVKIVFDGIVGVEIEVVER